MKVKSESEVAQSCPTLCDAMDCSLPGSSVHGIFQAKVLEWGAIAFSKGFGFLTYLLAIQSSKQNTVTAIQKCVAEEHYSTQSHSVSFLNWGIYALKPSVYNAGHLGSIPGLGRSPGEGNGNPLQDYCLENPMDGGAWQATVHGVPKSRTRLSDFTFTFML